MLWTRPVILAALLVTFIYADSLSSNISTVVPDGCNSHGAVKCADEDGFGIDVSNTQVVPFNTSCWFKVVGRDIQVQRKCTQLGTERRWDDVLGELKVRAKRFIIAGAVAGIMCLFMCKSSKPPPPPNMPPILTCARLEHSSEVIAEFGKTTARVSWTTPNATDPEEGKIVVRTIPSSFKSGDEYPEGMHNVSFRAADSKGLSQQCGLSFRVKVLSCNPPRWPDHGDLECQSYTLGGQCSVNCKDGYHLDEKDSTFTCIKYGSSNAGWSRQVKDCNPNACGKTPALANGFIDCPRNKTEYGVTCNAQCRDGYLRNGSPSMTCGKDGGWNRPPKCEDTTGPVFDPGTCPNDIQVDIDSSNNTAKLDWAVPTGSDNSGQPPVIKERHGHTPGQRFTAGSHSVTYSITDNKGNVGYPCTFLIQVQTISCEPPSLNVTGAQHMMYDCPDLYRLGAVCTLSCRSGYPLGGAHSIQCINEGNSNPPVLKWDWNDKGLAPFCKETQCPDLKSPSNGALACSLWDHGNMCQLQCQTGFDVPLIQVRDGMYVCGKSDGKWRPDDNVPDCNPKRPADHMHLLSDLNYYTGKCNSSVANIEQIKNNFVKALNSSKFHEACVGVPECKAEFVNVTCGAVTTRLRRDLLFNTMQNRSARRLAYTVTFDLVLPMKAVPRKTIDQSLTDIEKMLNDMMDKIQIEVDKGHFDLPHADMRLDTDSFGPGAPDLVCPKGTLPKKTTASCSGCPTGRYFSGVSGECEYCPIGTYQDSPNSIECISCPHRTNTTGQGTVNLTQCLDYCKPGHFSPSGLNPCAACDSRSYQPNYKATQCLSCDPGKRTRSEGAINQTSCQDFDIQLDNKEVALKSSKSASALTLSTWLFLKQKQEELVIFQLTSANKNYEFSVFRGFQNLDINSSGLHIDTGASLSTLKWHHLVVTADPSSRKMEVFVNGKSVFQNGSFRAVKPNMIDINDSISIQGNMQISSYNVIGRIASNTEIKQWSTSCGANLAGAIVTSDDIAAFQTAKVTVPSMCDAIDECESSPCGHHKCINKKGDFECICSNGYTGKSCENKPDFCIENACKHDATCVDGNSNYTCSCAYGYSGDFCEKKAVDGGWSMWTKWTQCSKSCGSGDTMRSRQCTNPPPDPEGRQCQGSSSVTKECNVDKCPECSRLQRSHGAVWTCNETEKVTRCTLSCRPGLYFTETPLPYYECGSITGYKWNHQNDANPYARLPACSEVKPPVQMNVSLEGQYTLVSCSKASSVKIVTALQSKLTNLDCVKKGTCDADIRAKQCEQEGAKHKLTVVIHLQSTVKTNGSDFHFSSVAANKSAPSPSLVDFIQQTVALEKSAQQIFNNSVDFFQVVVDGKSQSVIPGVAGVAVVPSVMCPPGTVRLDVFCAECPTGSYCDGSDVHLCPQGQYQNQTGQTACEQCPLGKTTRGNGTVDISECEGDNADHRDALDSFGNISENSDGSADVQIIAIAVSVSVFLAIATSAVVYKLKRCVRKSRKGMANKCVDTFDDPGNATSPSDTKNQCTHTYAILENAASLNDTKNQCAHTYAILGDATSLSEMQNRGSDMHGVLENAKRLSDTQNPGSDMNDDVGNAMSLSVTLSQGSDTCDV